MYCIKQPRVCSSSQPHNQFHFSQFSSALHHKMASSTESPRSLSTKGKVLGPVVLVISLGSGRAIGSAKSLEEYNLSFHRSRV